MKKIFSTTMIFLINGSIFLSCTKDSTTSITPATSTGITGYWLGTFDGSVKEGESFKSDGTTVQYDFYGSSSTDTASCQYKATGTYTVSGTTVNFVVSFPSLSETFTQKGTIDTLVNPNTMSGTFTSPTGGNGTFSFTKQ